MDSKLCYAAEDLAEAVLIVRRDYLTPAQARNPGVLLQYALTVLEARNMRAEHTRRMALLDERHWEEAGLRKELHAAQLAAVSS